MSIIQRIRDKAAWIIIAAIALALIAFIVQDAFQGGGRGLFSGNSTTLGKVNGKKISYITFEERVKAMEEQYRNANYPVNEMMRQQIRDGIWNEYVDDIIYEKKFEELGMTITDAESRDILYGPNPPQQLQQQFTDPKTGVYDAQAAFQAIKGLKKGTAQYENFHGQFVPALEKGRLREKYTALLTNSVYVPKWMINKMNQDNNQTASISYVNVPYSTISDSSAKVSDQEISQYVNERKEAFKQEESRTIEYVLFDAGPNKADSTAAYEQVNNLKNEFTTTPDVSAFLLRNSSETPYFDGYVLKSKLQMANADTIRSLAEGQVFGPYLDGGNYAVAKMISKRVLPDSVKVRHILIKVADQQSGQIRTDSAAKKLIDSIVTAINAGTSFDTMVVKLSEDEGSKGTGGVYDFGSTQFSTLSREFAETAFYGKAGDKKTVRTENNMYTGYHYIEVVSQKNFEEAYKVAYFSKAIVPSDMTANTANGLASQFAAESRNRKQLDENARKKNINKFLAADIKPLDYTILGIGDSRELVRWIYEAKQGDVSDKPFLVGDKYVVPSLVAIYEEGTMSPDKARPLVEFRIRNNKKAEQIEKKIGAATTLEAVAQATSQTVGKADSVLFGSANIPNIGQEYKVVGAAFNKVNQSKISTPIRGELGVFVIKTNSIGSLPASGLDAGQQQKFMQQQQRSFASRILPEIIRSQADIKDERVKFF
jgi:peptidyl-prolyl cis-trans isomerase D